MNMANTDDWRGEGFIRAPRKLDITPQPCEADKFTAARIRDANTIRPLAATKTRAEIKDITGLTANRIYEVCTWFNIQPVDHPDSCMKRKRAK